MKIFTASQIRACDDFTIRNEPVSSLLLMERAAQKCTDYLFKYLDIKQKIYIFCGNGNNGGDGFAIARMLYYLNFDVEIYINKSLQSFSKDATINFNFLKELSGIEIKDFSEFDSSEIDENEVIIDAVFGSGLNRKLEGELAETIEKMNSAKGTKISIDIPSGLFCDEIIETDAVVFKADYTVGFQFYKKAFLHPETGKYCGKIEILDIGLHQKYISETETCNFTIDDDLIKEIYLPRNEFSHKGNFGKTCIIAGSFGKIGAAVLATKSALKTGSGLTYILAPKCCYEILQTSCPEAMFLYGGNDFIQNFEVENDFTCGIGAGLGTDPETEDKFLEFLNNYAQPLVLDADALNILAKNPENLNLIPRNSIITPHPKEFARLFGETKNSFERLNLVKIKAKELQIFIVLKDHHTQVVTPEGEVFYNITGNSGLAKGGSGDVLLGMITSLLAQNYSSKNAAIFGVWLHGKAADLAAEKFSKQAMQPSDVIDNLGEVFKKIY